MHIFNELGSLIEQRWRDQNYDEDVFPEIAAEALAEAALDKHVSPWEIIRWLFNTTHIPNQQDLPGRFGNPPITLFTGPRFHIDIYFWLDGTTSVHQHAFCGAFQVLAGSSIHSHYSFECRQQINEHFHVGETKLEQVELLEQGRIKQILPGARYIHSLFHLDRPSATICVRTYHTASGAPQYNYVRPSFAIDPFFSEPLTIKQTQSAALLLAMEHPEALEMIDDLLAGADFQTTFSILDLARGHLGGKPLDDAFGLKSGEDQFQRLFETARHRHGELADLIPPVFEESRRQNNLIHRRGRITSPEHRFFLALLLNVPGRERVLEMVAQRFTDRDPVETVMDWMDELVNTKMLGSAEPNVLGIENGDDDYLFVFECLLRGRTLEQTVTALEEETTPEYAQQQEQKITELYHSISSSILFKSIFADSAASACEAAAL
ncbi:MAG TPA: hypothetical protein VNQ79_19095 [Blastocatellia bacterium]|nr:hypothetical protein [Blastocatellia bacterium]